MNKKDSFKLDARALLYHSQGKPGKTEVIPTKRTKTQRDLSLAYSPGVAAPCRKIQANKNDVYKYTSKGNLVAVISNGTAVLGLGNIGPDASKPVMEGKAVLFKVFSDIDVFDIEINEKDPYKFIEIVKSLEPTFGGINLEDIKSPDCFLIEETLKKQMNIPVMHDDQHGTAIISGAALINALILQKKKINKAKFVISGAGAASKSCCQMYVSLGANPKNFLVFDSKGLIYKNRKNISEHMKQFCTSAKNANIDLEKALKEADVFIGLSIGNIISKKMIKSMAKNPIVFAMANPTPEISWDDACSIRKDIIMATGRSDYPNQVNNVLGFPYIFRGALDVRSTHINEDMKMAAVKALAKLTHKPVPEMVSLAYDSSKLSFGKNYIIPKPLDPRLLSTIAPAVAKAAIDSGVAQEKIKDWQAYEVELNQRLGYYNHFIHSVGTQARKLPKRVVFAEGENISIIKAAQSIFDEGIGFPILLGNKKDIHHIAREHGIDLNQIPICNPGDTSEIVNRKRLKYAKEFYKERQRKGVTQFEAEMTMKRRTYFGCMMVKHGDADTFISGLETNYSKTLKSAIETVGIGKGVKLIAGTHIISTEKKTLFLADTTVNINPDAEELADITIMVANGIRHYGIEPKIAMLSYSNFGSSKAEEAIKVKKACAIVKAKQPDLKIDGEMHANIALNKDHLKKNFSFSTLVDEEVNCLIFPNLSASNICYNLISELSDFEYIGPIIVGLKEPINTLQIGSSVRNIINMAIVSVVEAQQKERKHLNWAKVQQSYFWKNFHMKVT